MRYQNTVLKHNIFTLCVLINNNAVNNASKIPILPTREIHTIVETVIFVIHPEDCLPAFLQ